MVFCARLPDSILLKKTQVAFWGATKGSIAFGITIDVPPFSGHDVPSGLAVANASRPRPSSMSFFSTLPSVATDYVFWLLGSSTLFCHGFTTCKEPTVARVSSSASLFLENQNVDCSCVLLGLTPIRRCAWGSILNSSDLKPLGSPIRRKIYYVTYLPDYHQTDWYRVSRLEIFTDGGFKRNFEGREMAGWGVAIDSPENFVRTICGPVVCDPRLPSFLGATSCSNNTAELTGFAEAVRWANSFILRGARLRILFDSKHAARVTVGVAHVKRNIALARTCKELL